MTICFVSDGRPGQVGGIASFHTHIASLLTGAGHTVIVLYISDSGEETKKEEGLLTTVITGKHYASHLAKWKPYFRPGGFNAPNWIAMGMCVREWLLTNHILYQVDIIEVTDYGGLGIFLCDAELPPVIVTGHGSLMQFRTFNFIGQDDNAQVVQNLERLSYQYADGVIVHSQLNKENLQQLFPDNYIAEALMPWVHTRITNVPTASGNLLTIGGLQPVKGVYTALETLELLKKKSTPCLWQWIGGNTWLAKDYRSVADDLEQQYPDSWQQQFQWLRELPFEETQRTLAAASLVVIPALFETFNYVALEAAANRKALLITEGTGAAAFFKHGHSAWIVPSNDPAAMAEAISYLMERPDLRQQLGENALTQIQQQFTAAAIVVSRLQVYKSILHRTRKGQPGIHPSLQFLNKYQTFSRKLYYCTRRVLKKLAGRK
ncbi:MAG: glycosyltransferase family 4 protein [Bacteroidetes bacterium]|nr:glycosyltransferase family 4 protein [Bacteroidota bacterium]